MWPLIKFLRDLKKTFVLQSKDPTPQLWRLWRGEAVLENEPHKTIRNSQGRRSWSVVSKWVRSLPPSYVKWESNTKEGIKGSQSLTHFLGRAEVRVKLG